MDTVSCTDGCKHPCMKVIYCEHGKRASYGAAIVRLDALLCTENTGKEKISPMIRRRGNFYKRSMHWQNLWDLRFCRRSTRHMMKIYETLAEKGYATYDFFLPGLSSLMQLRTGGNVPCGMGEGNCGKKIPTVMLAVTTASHFWI